MWLGVFCGSLGLGSPWLQLHKNAYQTHSNSEWAQCNIFETDVEEHRSVVNPETARCNEP